MDAWSGCCSARSIPTAHYRHVVRRHGIALALALAGMRHPSLAVELARTRARRYLSGTLRMLRQRAAPRRVPSPRREDTGQVTGEVTHLVVAARQRAPGAGRQMPHAGPPMRSAAQRPELSAPGRHPRRRRVAGLVVVILAGSAVQAMRPIPPPRLSASLAGVRLLPGPALQMPWPADGSAAVMIPGVGLLGRSGPRAPVPIASIAKVMTAYVVLRDHPLAPGSVGPEISFGATDVALYRAERSAGGSVLAVVAGERPTELQALEALLVPSADNIARPCRLQGGSSRSQGLSSWSHAGLCTMALMSGAPVRTEPPSEALGRALAIRRQRRVWSRRAPSWDHADMPGLDKVMAAVVAAAGEVEGRSAVDLGCGTGQVALRLARAGAFVVAVDVSPEMIARLRHDCPTALAGAIESVVAPIEDLELASASVDLVVSNYALHHLRDSDKARVVAQAERWLRPGGRLVIGDMMLGRGADQRDRRIIASKVAILARRGPGGWWRIAKNGARFWFRLQERPVSMAAWAAMLAAAGFTEVGARAVVAEAAVVWGTKGLAAPAPSAPPQG